MSTVNIQHQGGKTYLESKKYILQQIQKCKINWQVSVWEASIGTIFLKKVWNETKSHWLTSSHCNDLQHACLQKRCEILAKS